MQRLSVESDLLGAWLQSHVECKRLPDAQVSVLLAADVVYDNALTDAFLDCAARLMRPQPGLPVLKASMHVPAMHRSEGSCMQSDSQACAASLLVLLLCNGLVVHRLCRGRPNVC